MTAQPASRPGSIPGAASWRVDVVARVGSGEARLAGLFATGREESATLTAVLVDAEKVYALNAHLDGDPPSYRSLTMDVPCAFWYERALHDLSGVRPIGHPRLDPLLLPLRPGTHPPRPGRPPVTALTPAEVQGPTDVSGHGMFTIAHGPVRSGVFESVEYLIETPGEDIPHLNIRPHYKHRGIAKAFEGLTPQDGVLVAERVEGVSSVAHALAFSHALEALAGVAVDERAGQVRLAHAELERIANHLDVAMRLCDAAGLAVATSRFGWHKEQLMRLVSRLCGNRFGRGVVVPGGVREGGPVTADVDWSAVARDLQTTRRRIEGDASALMRTASFLDRLRGTGVLEPDLARRWGALGPIGRASGYDDDHRRVRPYDGYRAQVVPAVDAGTGDARDRLAVRWQEIGTAFDLLDRSTCALAAVPATDRRRSTRPPLAVPDGRGLGAAESAQGEVVHSVEVCDGRIVRCFARSASFHNLALFHDVFHGDILTDFAFIEASFGLSMAGVAM